MLRALFHVYEGSGGETYCLKEFTKRMVGIAEYGIVIACGGGRFYVGVI